MGSIVHLFEINKNRPSFRRHRSLKKSADVRKWAQEHRPALWRASPLEFLCQSCTHWWCWTSCGPVNKMWQRWYNFLSGENANPEIRTKRMKLTCRWSLWCNPCLNHEFCGPQHWLAKWDESHKRQLCFFLTNELVKDFEKTRDKGYFPHFETRLATFILADHHQWLRCFLHSANVAVRAEQDVLQLGLFLVDILDTSLLLSQSGSISVPFR